MAVSRGSIPLLHHGMSSPTIKPIIISMGSFTLRPQRWVEIGAPSWQIKLTLPSPAWQTGYRNLLNLIS